MLFNFLGNIRPIFSLDQDYLLNFFSFQNVDNQHLPANQFPLHTCYGDGEEITDQEVDEIRSVTWSNAMSLKLQPGDVLLLDNLLALHSRMSYEGGDRKILVNLSY